jgi:hypothetical protein
LLLPHGMWIRAVWSLHGVSAKLPRNTKKDCADEDDRWANEICSDDTEERAMVVASMNDMSYLLQIWLPLIIWQQVDTPNYQKGYITVVFLAVLMITTAFTISFLWARELLRYVVA